MVRYKLWKWGTRFGTWNVKSLFRPASLMTMAREALYEQKIILFSMEKAMKIILYTRKKLSVVKSVRVC